MKIETNVPEKKFTPVKLTLTFESAEELQSLWHRMNIGIDLINPNYMQRYSNADKALRNKVNFDIWNVIEDASIKLGINCRV